MRDPGYGWTGLAAATVCLALLSYMATCGGAARADELEHVCGEGPVEIDIVYPTACTSPEPPRPEPNGFGGYTYSPSISTYAVQCWGQRVEVWSDWPECPDSALVDAIPVARELSEAPAEDPAALCSEGEPDTE